MFDKVLNVSDKWILMMCFYILWQNVIIKFSKNITLGELFHFQQRIYYSITANIIHFSHN